MRLATFAFASLAPLIAMVSGSVASRTSALAAELDGQLIITELRSGGNSEWIEFANTGTAPMDLAGLEIVARDASGGETVEELPDSAGTLAPGDRYVVCLSGDESFCHLCLPSESGLDRDGGSLEVWRRSDCSIDDELVDLVRWPIEWQQGPTQGRPFDRGDVDDILCWLASPSPGFPNGACIESEERAWMNEIASGESTLVRLGRESECSYPGCPDWIEITYGRSGEPIDLGGYRIVNGDGEAALPAGLVVGPERPYVIVLLSPEARRPDWPGDAAHARFALKRSGDGVALYSPERSTFDATTIPALAGDESWSRRPDTADGARRDWARTRRRTPGRANEISLTGTPPKITLLGRFPLRVTPADPIEIWIEVDDADDDLDDVEGVVLRWKLRAVESKTFFERARRPATTRIPGDTVFRAEIPAQAAESLIELFVEAIDQAGQSSRSEVHEVWVQESDWRDPDPRQATDQLRINEISAAGVDPKGDWVEIFNRSDSRTVFLDGMLLSDSVLSTANRELPPGVSIPPRGFLIVRLDNRSIPDPVSPHLPFRLSRDTGGLVLVDRDGRTIIDAISWREEKPERTLGRFPDGGETLAIQLPTEGAPNVIDTCLEFRAPREDTSLVINEICADNRSVIADPRGEHGDWIELFNRGAERVRLDGWKLADLGGPLAEDARRKTWDFPPGLDVGPGEFLFIWCDNDDCETTICPEESGSDCEFETELHASIELNRLREFIGLVGSDGTLVDCVSFGYQFRDLSAGRIPDGGEFASLLDPSPAGPNARARGFSFVVPDCARTDLRNGFVGDHCVERPPEPRFLRGDSNGDCAVGLPDAVYSLIWLFLGGPGIACPDGGDVDDSGGLDIVDPIHLLGWLFLGGPAPPSPGPVEQGSDSTHDELPICVSTACEEA
jgi:hypothetical protein